MASSRPPASDQDGLFEFPCKFPVKAMGRNQDGFEKLVLDIVLAHAQMYTETTIQTSASGAGNYLSVTIHIVALSRAQLDRIYQDLSDCEQVLVAL